jgi:hypothetical protein
MVLSQICLPTEDKYRFQYATGFKPVAYNTSNNIIIILLIPAKTRDRGGT